MENLKNDNGENERELESFFSELAQRLDLVASYEAKIARFEAPRFNVFDYIEPDENKATEVLADLLDPNGRHAQGSIFLHSFLERVGFGTPSKDAITSAVVRTEYRTKWNRRLDLAIIADNWILALENKIEAEEQSNQVGDYIEFLDCDANGKWFFIFLTPSGRIPKECDRTKWDAAREAGNVLPFSYKELSAWLRSCVSLSSSDRVRALIQDMANWAENLRGGNMTSDLTTEVILDFVKKKNDLKFLKILLAIEDSSDAVRKGLISDFGKSLEQALMARFPLSAWAFDSRIGERELAAKSPGIAIRKHSWRADCGIGFEADSLAAAFGYGVFSANANATIRGELQSALKKLAKGKSTKTWPWYDDVPNFGSVQARNWKQSETIAAMHGERRSEFIQHFVNLITDVTDVVGSILDKEAEHE